jgi:hypothetical protein
VLDLYKYEHLLGCPEPWTLDNYSNNATGTLVDPDMTLFLIDFDFI